MENINLPSKKKWVKVKLGDLASTITKGSTPTTYGFNYLDKGIPFIKIENIENDKISHRSIKQFISNEAHEYQSRSQLQEGDILFSIAGTIGKTCIVTKNDIPSNTNQALSIIRGTKKYLLPKFLKLQFLSILSTTVKKKARGGAMSNISLNDLEKMDILLPSIQEQNRIVEKIEELFSDLDKATEDLKKTQEQLKIYRQAVLKAAFEGNKTSNWKQMKLGGLIKVKSGNGLTRSQRLSSGIFFVYGGNGILGKHNKYMFEETKLIIGRVGVNCGNVHITRPKSWVTDNAFIASYDNEKACQEYLLYYLEFLNLNKYAGSTAQPVISGHKIYPIDIKLPNKKEQFEIFSKIEKNFSIINKLKETVEQNLSKIEYLRQSILKKAFEGKLVPQNPNDEPAKKLLERIKQEKVKFESNNKKRKKR